MYWCLCLSLILLCPTSLLSSWMEDRLTWESNEARDTSTTHYLVTADAPLNPSTTNQRYYIISSVNRAGQWLQVEYCFHLSFSEVKWESHPLRCQDCQRMTNDSDTIKHFHLSFHSKEGKARHTQKKAVKQALRQFTNNSLKIRISCIRHSLLYFYHLSSLVCLCLPNKQQKPEAW